MRLVISSVDYEPPELADQLPLGVALVREIPGPDRPDYWLGRLDRPVRWIADGTERMIDDVIVCSRWVGRAIAPGAKDLPIGIAYVTDPRQLEEQTVDFAKCKYVAIGLAHEQTDGSLG